MDYPGKNTRKKILLKTCDNYDSYLDKLLKIDPKPDLKAIELLISPYNFVA